MTVYHAPSPKNPIDAQCDFCGLEYPICDFICPDFTVSVILGENKFTQVSEGYWGACEKCRDLIRADKREELLNRCQGSNPLFNIFPEARKNMKVLQDKFFELKTGEQADPVH